MSNLWLKRLVAFCVLMETGDGILTKSPDYVLEKWELARDINADLLEQLMDPINQAKFKKYLDTWLV